VNNPQYSLIMQKDSSSAMFFAPSENSTRNDETIIWKRTENCPSCLTENDEIKAFVRKPNVCLFRFINGTVRKIQ
jgi:hypothetical protein